MSAPINRKELSAILEEFGGSLAMFDKWREDSYLRAVAGVSLESLEHVLEQLFWPGQTAEQARQKCPPWPPGTKRAGQMPSCHALNNIIAEFNVNQTLNDIAPIKSFQDQLMKAIKGTPIGDNDHLTQAVIALAGQELLKAKQGGVPISQQMDVVDRMQSQGFLQAKKTELKLKRDRFEFDAAKACLKMLPSLRQIAADTSLDQNAKINAIREKLFGEIPE